ncbi:nucleotidyltransferase domain-containing protein [Thiospirochaeta perfilievii]|uniref:Nucleotidyltransferase domain-containing protein n=1 Tax=Thiospirochaeta perfilievii TaxID=252967 RepID=A0A5C1QE53_9SPIO|nr:nucleotidyltransferase domain-containing protein [Thiospirochaeta perfilievii]QEN05340.1 nucleotidyltransferase domain-containing protein [Thiospirochaeta perfilievii]
MIADIDLIKKDITERLKVLNPEKIILFGSYAYGNPSEDSDLDICVVEDKVESKIAEKTKIRALLKDIRVSKDIIVSYKEEYDFYKTQINSVFYDIETKGDLLWQRNS